MSSQAEVASVGQDWSHQQCIGITCRMQVSTTAQGQEGVISEVYNTYKNVNISI